jgi:hypothetical protein
MKHITGGDSCRAPSEVRERHVAVTGIDHRLEVGIALPLAGLR